ncbi:MAG TPA: Smr/MutS family protein [Candidatus Coprenecus stercoravium]|uniref:Smr/MutS family protein n=1 Tax=Candidatus Coprenecus stercoravium TaxID=2840735 RepID=A0A9D2K9Z2_9BACT|nr:Smr/MutS family protein [Candidatus Coprenecus stercoravium]
MYKAGDRVRFMDSGESGTVVDVVDVSTLSIDVDGMVMRVNVSEVVPLSSDSMSDEEQMYDTGGRTVSYKVTADARPVKSVRSRNNVRHGEDRMEVDLHIEAVRRKYPAARNIPDDDVLYVQLEVFDKSMAEAFRKGARSVVFIHGNGRGILRMEIMKRLRDYPGVTCSPASALRYGSGALEVFIK